LSFCTVKLLIRLFFQSEAPRDDGDAGDVDAAAIVAGAEGMPSEVEEVAKGKSRARSPQEDVEANAYAKKAEV
jgi:hypothetical protein